MTYAEALDRSYGWLEHQLLQAAEAMPAEKFNFRPTPEVRTFGEQLRHIAAVQWVVGAWLQDAMPPADVGDGDNGQPSMTDKAEILNYLRASFAYIRSSLKTVNEHNALEIIPHPYDPTNTKLARISLAMGYANHGWNHYGQIVVYQRLNGVAPPPSR
jgi:uncharacterized damage-inducible protein DinB